MAVGWTALIFLGLGAYAVIDWGIRASRNRKAAALDFAGEAAACQRVFDPVTASPATPTEPPAFGNWSRAHVASWALSGKQDPRPLPSQVVRVIVTEIRTALKSKRPGVAAGVLMFHLAELPDVSCMLGASQWWAHGGESVIRSAVEDGTCDYVLLLTADAGSRDLSEPVRSVLVGDALADLLVWHAMTSRIGVAQELRNFCEQMLRRAPPKKRAVSPLSPFKPEDRGDFEAKWARLQPLIWRDWLQANAI